MLWGDQWKYKIDLCSPVSSTLFCGCNNWGTRLCARFFWRIAGGTQNCCSPDFSLDGVEGWELITGGMCGGSMSGLYLDVIKGGGWGPTNGCDMEGMLPLVMLLDRSELCVRTLWTLQRCKLPWSCTTPVLVDAVAGLMYSFSESLSWTSSKVLSNQLSLYFRLQQKYTSITTRWV